MKRLDNLSEMASRQLGGLEATPTLWAKIRLEAAEKQQPRRAGAYFREVRENGDAVLIEVPIVVLQDCPEKLTQVGRVRKRQVDALREVLAPFNAADHVIKKPVFKLCVVCAEL